LAEAAQPELLVEWPRTALILYSAPSPLLAAAKAATVDQIMLEMAVPAAVHQAYIAAEQEIRLLFLRHKVTMAVLAARAD
jgi:hypothetical protein